MTKITAILALVLALALGASTADAASSFSNPGSRVMLNPQPLPPGGGVVAGRPALTNPAGRVMLNPQPLPPRTR